MKIVVFYYRNTERTTLKQIYKESLTSMSKFGTVHVVCYEKDFEFLRTKTKLKLRFLDASHYINLSKFRDIAEHRPICNAIDVLRANFLAEYSENVICLDMDIILLQNPKQLYSTLADGLYFTDGLDKGRNRKYYATAIIKKGVTDAHLYANFVNKIKPVEGLKYFAYSNIILDRLVNKFGARFSSLDRNYFHPVAFQPIKVAKNRTACIDNIKASIKKNKIIGVHISSVYHNNKRFLESFVKETEIDSFLNKMFLYLQNNNENK